jgi:hypothetical protein
VQKWKVSSQRQADIALRDARESDKKGNRKDCLAALERAIHAAIEASTGLRSRGILRDELGRQLVERGIREGLAEKVVTFFADCEALRFEPESGQSKSGDLIDRANRLVSDLPAKARRKSA